MKQNTNYKVRLSEAITWLRFPRIFQKSIKLEKIIILISLAIVFIYANRRLYDYYSPAKERHVYKTNAPNSDTLRIAYIGDSWAYLHNKHNCQIAQLLEDSIHHPVMVYSLGLSGFTSKEIYNALFDVEEFKHFMKKGYHYCYISAGINDTYKKMGTSYYQKSMDCLIRFLLANHIQPIIQEIPDYDINKAYQNQETNIKLTRQLSMLINGVSLDCKQEFRDALEELIKEKGYQDQVSIVRYQSWNNNYSDDLMKLYLTDGIHLNDYGYSVLDSTIATICIAAHESNKK